jgi:hypothetical protein
MWQLKVSPGRRPFLGAVFDTVFKANRRNYELLKNHLPGSRRQAVNDWLFVFVTGVLVASERCGPGDGRCRTR